jgi:hypothetical protein
MKKMVVLSLAVLVVALSCWMQVPLAFFTGFVDGFKEAQAELPIECSDDSCLDACLERINTVMQTQPFDSLDEYAGLDATFNLVIYPVSNGELGEPVVLYVPEEYRKYQEDYEAQQRIWDYSVALLPEGELKWINEFMVYTDGPYNNLAYVSYDETGRSLWTLGADIIDSDDPLRLTETLVHEFAHMITLNSEQISETINYSGWNQENPECTETFNHEYGCTKPNSYMNKFYQEFWVDLFSEWKSVVIDGNTHAVQDEEALVMDFYNLHPDQFFYAYAATSITEDMAVSFEYFVMEPKPDSDETVLDRKILFFYQFPELVEMRTQMIHAMCSYEG